MGYCELMRASLGAQRRVTEPNQGFREDFVEDKKELAGREGREAFQVREQQVRCPKASKTMA